MMYIVYGLVRALSYLIWSYLECLSYKDSAKPIIYTALLFFPGEDPDIHIHTLRSDVGPCFVTWSCLVIYSCPLIHSYLCPSIFWENGNRNVTWNGNEMRLKYVSHDMDPLTVCVSQVGVVFWSVGQCSSSHDVLIQRISRMPDPPYMYMPSVPHVTSTTCHQYHMSHVITVSSQPSLHVHVISTTCHMSPQCPPNPPYMYMSSVPHVTCH